MSPFCKKLFCSVTAMMLSLIIVSNVYGEVPAVNSAVQASSTFSSFGTIYIPEQPASPPPPSLPPESPPSESPPSPSPSSDIESTDLIGLGDDYLIYYSDGSPEVWDQDWIRARFTTYNVNSVRLGFLFSDAPGAGTTGYGSLYNYDKMDRVLDILRASDVKGILLLQNNGVSCKNYAGSWAWVNNWLSVTEQFKGDSRVAAFSIFGEPAHDDYYDTWATDGPVGAITNRYTLQQAFAYLINEIHEIDPDRVIIYPMGTFSYTNPQDWYNDIQSVGMANEPNVIFDIVHPYFFEKDWDMGLTPAQKAQWYENTWVQPSVNLFGADRCWCGETFCWDLTHDLQVQFLTEMINVFVEYDMGFQVWAYWSSSVQSWQNEAIEASNY